MGQSRPDQHGPSGRPNLGTVSTKVGSNWSISGRVFPNLPDVGQMWHDFGQIWFGIDRIGPESTKLGQVSSDFDQKRDALGQVSSDFEQSWPNVDEVWPKRGRLCRDEVAMAQCPDLGPPIGTHDTIGAGSLAARLRSRTLGATFSHTSPHDLNFCRSTGGPPDPIDISFGARREGGHVD